MGRFKIICVDGGVQEIFNEYDDIDKVIWDMGFKDPNNFL